jgi:uncharacterized protein YciI
MAMKHFMLFYDYGPDYMARRGALRDPHMAHLKTAAEQGDLVFGGACIDGDPLAVVLFKTESAARVEEFARNDPYVTGGLARSWNVREYFMVDRDMLLQS